MYVIADPWGALALVLALCGQRQGPDESEPVAHLAAGEADPGVSTRLLVGRADSWNQAA